MVYYTLLIAGLAARGTASYDFTKNTKYDFFLITIKTENIKNTGQMVRMGNLPQGPKLTGGGIAP